MSDQPAPPELPSDCAPPTIDHDAADDDFEFSDGAPASPAAPSKEDLYWYAESNTQLALGPVPRSQLVQLLESHALGAQCLVWHKGLPAWTRAAEHLKVAPAVAGPGLSSPCALPQPPAFVAKTGWQSAWEWVQHGVPPASVYRLVGRGLMAAGVIILLLSIPLSILGMSWFAGGLQFLLIAVALEIGGLIRDSQGQRGSMESKAGRVDEQP